MPGRPPTAGPVYAQSFYLRRPEHVARALLGAMLVHGECAGRIVETEAYLARDDPAAHAFRGRTPRTEVLFGPPGRAYVYRTRGHCCLNVVVQPAGTPGCVLIRGLVPVAGTAAMRLRRGAAGQAPAARLANGPAKLCQALGVDMRHYGADLRRLDGLRIVRAGRRRRSETVRTTGRIGVSQAGDRPLRFLIEGAYRVDDR